MKILRTTLITLTALVYLAACTTTFEDYIHQGDTMMLTRDDDAMTPKGFLQCDDYLTNVPVQNYCSQTVPEDWQDFDFNGEQFYMVPLLSEDQKSVKLKR